MNDLEAVSDERIAQIERLASEERRGKSMRELRHIAFSINAYREDIAAICRELSERRKIFPNHERKPNE